MDDRLVLGHIRKSRVIRGQPTRASYKLQRADILACAATYRDADAIEITTDWGRSGGDEHLGRRLHWQETLELIKAGRVRVLYGFDLQRLTRGMTGYMALVTLCRDHGTSVRLAHGGEMNYETAEDALRWNVIAAVGAYERDKARDRSKGLVRMRIERGDKIGPRFYGDGPDDNLAAVIAAVEEAGSANGAARLLNRRGIPTRNRDRLVLSGPEDEEGTVVPILWSSTPVREIIRRVRPDLLPPASHHGWGQGVPGKSRVPLKFYRLVTCHCGRIMTGSRERRIRARDGLVYSYLRYTCADLRHVPDHGPGNVAESTIERWTREEAALLELPPEAGLVAISERNQDRERALTEERDMLGALVRERLMTLEDAVVRRDAIEAELRDIDLAGAAVKVPAIDWDWPPAAISEYLRGLWVTIHVDAKCRPVAAEWRVPEWRRGSSPGGLAAGAA